MAKSTKKPKPAPLPAFDQMGTIQIELPELLEVPPDVYCVRHVEGVLDDAQAMTLKRLLHTLEFRGEQLADGTYVTRPAHAIRWILERIDVHAHKIVDIPPASNS